MCGVPVDLSQVKKMPALHLASARGEPYLHLENPRMETRACFRAATHQFVALAGEGGPYRRAWSIPPSRETQKGGHYWLKKKFTALRANADDWLGPRRGAPREPGKAGGSMGASGLARIRAAAALPARTERPRPPASARYHGIGAGAGAGYVQERCA